MHVLQVQAFPEPFSFEKYISMNGEGDERDGFLNNIKQFLDGKLEDNIPRTLVTANITALLKRRIPNSNNEVLKDVSDYPC